MHKFSAVIKIIGVNPFVFVPEKILKSIFIQSGKEKGPIAVHGTINKSEYRQTLVKYAGDWRLYINTTMLKDSPKRIGEKVSITIAFDPVPRKINPHPKLVSALKKNKEAKKAFDKLSPSRQNEIVRYISFLKTEEIIVKNIDRAINFLTGKGRFVGREK